MNNSDKILNMLFIKRFCLPVNTDIESYETGINSINKSSEICGNYNHISCILQGKKSKILSFGIKRGYNLQYIYYSDTLGNIIKTRLYDLDNEDKHISQSYRKLLKNI